MNLAIIYFSATGNTQKSGKAVKEQFIELKAVVVDIDITNILERDAFKDFSRQQQFKLNEEKLRTNEDRKILLNCKVKDVNVESYVKMNYEQYIELYDKWYPYYEIVL